jgi:hypothetical protein
MTTQQIEYVIGERYGYPLDEWTSIPEITSISFVNDSNLYCDPSNIRFKFNTSTGMLELAYGKIVDGSFVSSGGLTENYTPESFIDFNLIQGIFSSVWLAPHGGFLQKGF